MPQVSHLHHGAGERTFDAADAVSSPVARDGWGCSDASRLTGDYDTLQAGVAEGPNRRVRGLVASGNEVVRPPRLTFDAGGRIA